jgi:hypothetical protein
VNQRERNGSPPTPAVKSAIATGARIGAALTNAR